MPLGVSKQVGFNRGTDIWRTMYWTPLDDGPVQKVERGIQFKVQERLSRIDMATKQTIHWQMK